MRKREMLAFVIAVAVFAYLAISITLTGNVSWDQEVREELAEGRSQGAVEVLNALTIVGDTGPVVGILVVLLIALTAMKRWKSAILLFVSLAVAFLSNQLLKALFARERPPGIALIEVDGYSFPSGNAMIAVAFYGFAGYLFWSSAKSPATRRVVCIITVLLVLLIGISRIYLGIHYPSDIAAGYALGIVIFMLMIAWNRRWAS